MTAKKEKKSKLKSVFSTLTTILCVLLVLLAVLIIFSKKNNEVIFIGDKAFVFVLSDSMAPLIPAKTYIEIEKAEPKDIKVDDIITFYSDDPGIQGSLNTHQVVEIIGDNEEFVTRGLNNHLNDAYTAKADKVVARYVKNIGFLTTFANWFLTPEGLIACAVVLVLLTAIPFIVEAVKKAKRADDASAES